MKDEGVMDGKPHLSVLSFQFSVRHLLTSQFSVFSSQFNERAFQLIHTPSVFALT
jgi:hypothetical protein